MDDCDNTTVGSNAVSHVTGARGIMERRENRAAEEHKNSKVKHTLHRPNENKISESGRERALIAGEEV